MHEFFTSPDYCHLNDSENRMCHLIGEGWIHVFYRVLKFDDLDLREYSANFILDF